MVQAMSRGILDVLIALLPSPSPEYRKKCSNQSQLHAQSQHQQLDDGAPSDVPKGPSNTIFAALQLPEMVNEEKAACENVCHIRIVLLVPFISRY